MSVANWRLLNRLIHGTKDADRSGQVTKALLTLTHARALAGILCHHVAYKALELPHMVAPRLHHS